MEVPYAEGDLKVGGKYKFGMQRTGTDGPVFELFGEYKVFDRPNKLVYTQASKMGGKELPDTEIAITLEETDWKTTMKFAHSGFPTEQERDQSGMGWPSAFDKLEAHVQSLA